MYINRKGIRLIAELRNQEKSYPRFVVHKYKNYIKQVYITKLEKLRIRNKLNNRKNRKIVWWKTYRKYIYYTRTKA